MGSGPPPGMQPLTGPIPTATPFPGESRLVARPDGTYAAVPAATGTTKTFRIVAREAPWTLKPGLTVMAKTYNGVVPGPVARRQSGRPRRHRLPQRAVDPGYDPSARHPWDRSRHGRRAGLVTGARPAARHLPLRLHGRATGYVHLSHARQQSGPQCGPLRRDRRHSDASSARRTRPRARLPRDHLLVVHQQQRGERVHAQRQGVSRDGRPQRPPRRAHPHSLDQHLRRKLPHDAHAWALHADHRSRRHAGLRRGRRGHARTRAGATRRRHASSPINSPGRGSSTATSSTTSKTQTGCPTA